MNTALVRHFPEQVRVLRSMAGAMIPISIGKALGRHKPVAPGEWTEWTESRVPRKLADDFRAWAGYGDLYEGEVPPSLYSQWAFPSVVAALSGANISLGRGLNAGTRMAAKTVIPAAAPLRTRARLAKTTERPKGTRLSVQVETHCFSSGVLEADFYIFVPKKRPKKISDEAKAARNAKRKSDAEREAEEIEAAQALDRVQIGKRAGLEFALLTGDFNPIHWIAPAAKLSGFDNCILHGFGSFALTHAALLKHLIATKAVQYPVELSEIEVRFRKPIRLPARPKVWVHDEKIWMAARPQGTPFLSGTYELDVSKRTNR